MATKTRQLPDYKPQEIEAKWQLLWQESDLYLTRENSDKPKFYCLDFFPYPSGDGLHVGHCRNYLPTDVISRFRRMQGYNVLHPMGWDSFGEPAEQYAVAHGVHPRITTDRNTANFRRQFRLIGTSYDWSREIDSSDPAYYRWTQWFFLLLYKRGLAYRDMNWQWWCPTCQTTLSSHEVSNGVCWRGHSGVIRRNIPAWYFRITAYADRLVDDLEKIDWPEHIKTIQRNWVGRSEGARVVFPFQGSKTEGVEVFTTRPDTLFGATFLVLAPEHSLVEHFTTPERQQKVADYKTQATRQSEVERMDESRPKTGEFTGGYATHPLTGAPVPVWIADYVLPTYGTGAIMAVPAHDQRDFDFAKQYDLEIRQVISTQSSMFQGAADPGNGVIVNSGHYNGLDNLVAAEQIVAELEIKGLGNRSIQYKMRDWLISRQRYWGTPIPIIHCQNCGEVPVPEDQLPVLLPPMDDFQPDGSGASPLARLPEFVNTTCPRCSGPARRETDTMGGFACSSWYFLRFTSPDYDEGPFDPERMRYWMPVDLYVGGVEHAVLHLLFSRFWVKVMYDAGLTPFDEPFARLLNQGQLMGPDGKRMSKSRGNVITPDHIAETYGTDSLRVYSLFMAPFEQDVSWSTAGINGARRFLNHVWRLYGDTFMAGIDAKSIDKDLEHQLHKTIRQVTERIGTLRFNTSIAALMEFFNFLAARNNEGNWQTRTFHQALEIFMVLLAPIAPHLAEELWLWMGHPESIHKQSWPVYDPELARAETIQIPVQINGKVRDVVEVSQEASESEIEAAVSENERIQAFLKNHTLVKTIYIPGRAYSIVVR
jgi:leucyl-tRNA synthetase